MKVTSGVIEQAEVIVARRQLEHEFKRKLSSLSPNSRASIWFKIAEPLPQEDLDGIATRLAYYFDVIEVVETETSPSTLRLTLVVPQEAGIAQVGAEWWAPLLLIIPATLLLSMIAWGVISGMPKLMEALGRAITPLGIAAICGATIYFVAKARKPT